MNSRAAALLAFAALATGAPASASPEGAPAARPAEPIPVDDFEAPELRPAWRAFRAQMKLVPGAVGQALEASADAGSTRKECSSVAVALPVKDLRAVGAVAFRFRAEGMPFVQLLVRKDLTVRALEESIDPSPEWKECVLPLRHMTEGSLGLLPDPADLDVLEFTWEGPGTIRLDDIRLLPGDRGDASWKVSEEDILELAFGRGRGQIQRGKHFSALWAAPGVDRADIARGLRDLEQYPALLASRWSLEAPPGYRLPVLLAANNEQVEEFRKRLWAMFQGWGRLPSVGSPRRGVNPFAITTPTSLGGSEKWIAEEELRLYLQRALGVGEHDAIVSAFHWAVARRLSPTNLPKAQNVETSDFKDRLGGRGGPILAWKELFDRDRQFHNAGQLASVVEFLAASYRSKLPTIWQEIRALRVEPDEGTPGAIAGALGKSIPEIQEEWMRWGAATWK